MTPQHGAAQRRHARMRRRWIRPVVIAVIGVLVLGVLGVAGYTAYLASAFDQTGKLDDVFPTDDASRPPEVEGAQTILLLGSDTRGAIDDLDDADGRSDTIIVVHIPADRRSIQVMSIMRDNWVDIPGHGMAKINAAMALGGVPLVVQTVEGFIGARIDHVALIDFAGFEGLTEALGGVTVDNPRAFRAVSGERFAAGEITLQGSDALAFARERKAFATGDYARVADQQLLIKAIVSRMLSTDTLANPVRTGQLVSVFAPYVKVDRGLDAGYAAGLGLSLAGLRPSDVRFFTSPTLGTGTIGGQSVVKPDWSQIQVIRDDIQSGALADYVPTGR